MAKGNTVSGCQGPTKKNPHVTTAKHGINNDYRWRDTDMAAALAVREEEGEREAEREE